MKPIIFVLLSFGILFFSCNKDNDIAAAHAFADQHFSKAKFLAYYDSLDTFFTQLSRMKGDLSPADTAAARMLDIFWVSEGGDYKTVISREIDGRTELYYRNIASKAFAQGWDDCDPTFNEIHLAGYNWTFTSSKGNVYSVHEDPDSAYLVGQDSVAPGIAHPQIEPIYGYSANQERYLEMLLF